MRNRKKLFPLLVLLGLLVVVFASCAADPINLSEYVEKGEDNLDVVARLVLILHEWIGNYGLTVILFTVFLKVLMLPLDIWQRFSMRKSSLKMQEIQPLLDAIDKRYGVNSEKARLEKQKVQSKQSLSMLSSCLPMIVTLLVIIFMFGGLRSYATYKNVTNYSKLESFYSQSLSKAKSDSDLEAYCKTINGGTCTEEQLTMFQIEVASKGLAEALADTTITVTDAKAQQYIGIAEFYNTEIKESFLWIQSIWQPDTWDTIFPTVDTFQKTVELTGSGELTVETYKLIRNEVLSTADRSWNGLMILPILSIGLSFLSIFITQKMDKRNRKGVEVEQNSQQAMTGKMNMILMPLMMAFFCFTYTGAVAVYMTVTYAISIVVSLFIKGPIDKMVAKSLEAAEQKSSTPKANYKR